MRSLSDIAYHRLEGATAEPAATTAPPTATSASPVWWRRLASRSVLLLLVTGFVVVRLIVISYGSFSSHDLSAPGKPINFSEPNRKTHSDYLKRLPQCIIIGVRKCGTRALLEFLDLHPEIRSADEEQHFFDHNESYVKGLEWYRQKMPLSYPHQITIEKTPAYFITDKVPQRIYAMNESIKLLVILREPATRVVSDYTQIFANRHSKNKSHPRFEQLALIPHKGQLLVNSRYKAVQTSTYHRHLRRWLRLFHLHQIHFVDGDLLVKDPVSELHRIEDFLGLEHHITAQNVYFNETRGFYCMRNRTSEWCLGATKGRKHPFVSPKVMQTLHTFFRPHNEKFFKLIGRTFDWP